MRISKSPRCQLTPLPDQVVAFTIDGVERLRWHASPSAPRPFFFPLVGPSGLTLTRMGHPGAPNHDHHRSVWFAHHKVLGIDFWSDTSDASIRQLRWISYVDGDDSARMAVELGWFDGHNPEPLILQELIAEVSPAGNGETFLELQTSLRSRSESLELGQTNFGLLAVRMAKAISAAFGGGVLTNADGVRTESKLFGKSSPWIDYSGPIEPGTIEGITYFDHRDNASFPSKWHVRDDGWMGASICRDDPVMLDATRPTTYRYLLHIHAGPVNLDRAGAIAEAFHDRAMFRVEKDTRPHHGSTIRRTG